MFHGWWKTNTGILPKGRLVGADEGGGDRSKEGTIDMEGDTLGSILGPIEFEGFFEWITDGANVGVGVGVGDYLGESELQL